MPEGRIAKDRSAMTRRILIEKCEWYCGKWPDPTTTMLSDVAFNVIWNTIKKWDIQVPENGDGFGTTGNHARAILDSLRRNGCL